MNKPSERIVVFVTTAQKRAISATADNLGISVSELMRRAVLSFGATSEQVKAASIVDRLRAPREPDALNAALQRVARASKHLRPTNPAARRNAGTPDENDTVSEAFDASGTSDVPPQPLAPIDLARPLEAAVAVTALATPATPDANNDTNAANAADHEAAARVAAARAAALASHDAVDDAHAAADTRTPSSASTLLASKPAAGKRQPARADDESGIDPAEGSGRFA
jgi:hypothetical protein